MGRGVAWGFAVGEMAVASMVVAVMGGAVG
jgi:hypothetical protein